MRCAIMQPYFLPYIGYWQLMCAVDVFVVYDNVKYTKKGWINRNRILVEGNPQFFSINLKRASDFAVIGERTISPVFVDNRSKILRTIRTAYCRAPAFSEVLPIIEECFLLDDTRLFGFIFFSIETIARHLGITCRFEVASDLPVDHDLRKEQKIWAICRALACDHYFNPEAGQVLYDREQFAQKRVRLSFLQAGITEYQQVGNAFVPSMSIVDVLMYNGIEGTKRMLGEYRII